MNGIPRPGARLLAAAALAGCGGSADEERSALDAPVARPARGDPETATTLARAAAARAAAGALDEARALFERALAADPACVAARVDYGFLLLEEIDPADYGGALAQFRGARAVEPHHALAACGEGIARQELGDVERAEPLLREALAAPGIAEFPAHHAAAAAALARIEAIRGRGEEALRRFDEAARIDGAPPRRRAVYRALRADLLAESGRDDEAEAEVRRAIGLDPENVRAHHLLGRLLGRRGARAEAAREARIHELLRELVDHRSRRVLLDHERRIALRRELNLAWPEHAGGRILLVRELLECGRFAEAVAEVDGGAGAAEPTLEWRGLAARARAGAGDLDGARAELEAMRRVAPDLPLALLLGVLQEWQRGNPSVTRAQMDARLREWVAR